MYINYKNIYIYMIKIGNKMENSQLIINITLIIAFIYFFFTFNIYNRNKYKFYANLIHQTSTTFGNTLLNFTVNAILLTCAVYIYTVEG